MNACRHAAARGGELTMPRILLVEDNEMNRDMLSPAPGAHGATRS